MTTADESLIDLSLEVAFRLGELEVRPSSREVAQGEYRDVIEPRVMQVLVALARRRGEVVSRDALIGACWGGRVVSDDAVSRSIMGVRRVAETHGGFSIETVPRVGYRLSELSADVAAAERASKPSIAVLPFANMSSEAEQSYFSDGITEDIITDLSKVSALFVVARHTAFTFKGRSVDVREVAKALGVSHVLEGSVRKSGGRLRISVQLAEGATGGQVWAERYDRELDDIFALQDEISRQVVAALKLRLLPEERSAIEARGTRSAAAYDLCLMAKKLYVTGDQGDPDWGETIVRLARRAAEIDPNYADAWAWLAMGQVAAQFMQGGSGDRGWTAAERALALNPNLGLARAVKARVFLDTGNHAEAEREMGEALRLAPESSVVNYQAGLVQFYQQRFEAAVGYFVAAQTLDDTDYVAASFAQACYDRLGDTAAVLRMTQTMLSHVEKVLAEDRNNSHAVVVGARALALLGKADLAGEWIERALLIQPDNLVVRYNAALCLADILPDAALDVLAPALEKASVNFLEQVRLTHQLGAIREHPRFKAAMAEAEARLAAADQAG